MKKLLMFLLLGMFLISFASATTEVFKQGEVVNYNFVCLDVNYNYCAESTTAFITITNPDGSNAVTNDNMTYNPTHFNYTLPTSNLGTYKVIWIAQGSDNAKAEWEYDVTATGSLQTTSQGIGSAMFLILMLSLTGLFGWVGFKLTESKNLWVLGIFFLFLSVVMIVYNVWLGYEFHRTLTGFADSSMPETIFYIFLFLLVVGLLTSVALLFTRWKEIFRYVKNEVKRKEEDVDDLDFNDDKNWR